MQGEARRGKHNFVTNQSGPYNIQTKTKTKKQQAKKARSKKQKNNKQQRTQGFIQKRNK